MAIDNFEYTHPNGWEDSVNFPTTPANETQTRQLLQEQHKEVRDYLKDKLVPGVNAHLAETLSQVGGVHGLEIEEGTFTPFFLPENGELDISYLTQTGRYKKIGNLIAIYIYLVPSSTAIGTASGYLRIGGLPFNPVFRTAFTIGNFFRFATDLDSKDARAFSFNSPNIIIYLHAASAYNLKELSVTDLFEGSGTYNQIIISGFYLI